LIKLIVVHLFGHVKMLFEFSVKRRAQKTLNPYRRELALWWMGAAFFV